MVSVRGLDLHFNVSPAPAKDKANYTRAKADLKKHFKPKSKQTLYQTQLQTRFFMKRK